MNVLEFISSLVWPVLVLVVVLILRPAIVQALSGQIKRAKVGPVEVEWDRTLSEARQELADAPGPLVRATESNLSHSESDPIGLMAELMPLVEIDPSAAVLEAYERVEAYLRSVVALVEPPRLGGVARVARRAQQLGLIGDETAGVFQGLAVLRNLAAHGHVPEDAKAKAIEYLALADAAMYAAQRDVAARRSANSSSS